MYDASDPFYMVMQKYNMKRGNTMIKAGIIGATGYAGAELVRILMNHKEVEIAWYLSLIHILKDSGLYSPDSVQALWCR